MNTEQLKQFIENFLNCHDNEQRKIIENKIELLIKNRDNLKLFFDTIILYQKQKNIVQIVFQFLGKMDIVNFEENEIILIQNFSNQIFFSPEIDQQIFDLTRNLIEIFCSNALMKTKTNIQNYEQLQHKLIQNVKNQISQGIDITKSIGIIATLNTIFKINSLLEIQKILEQAYNIVKLIEQEVFYTVLNQLDSQDYQNLNAQQKNMYNQCLFLIELFAEYYNILLYKKSNRNLNLADIIDNQQILQVFIDILFYDFFKCGNKLCLTIQNQQSYEFQKIYKIKLYIIEILLVITYSKNQQILSDYLKKYIFDSTIDNFIIFFSKEIGTNFDIRDIQDFKQLQNYIIKLIQVLSKGFSDINNFQKLNDLKYTLLSEVFVKAFYQTNNELDNLKDNQYEFHYNMLDLILYQNSKTVKSYIIKLFTKFISTIDGTSAAYFKLSLEIIYKSFEQIQQFTDVQYKYLGKINQNSFFVSFQPKKQIEIALTILIHLHEIINKRKDLQISLDYLLKRHIQNLIESDNLNQVKLLYLLDLIIENVPLTVDNNQQFKINVLQWVLTKALDNNFIAFYASKNISIIQKSKLLNQLGDDFSEKYLKTICQQLVQTQKHDNSIYILSNFIETRLEFLVKNQLNFMLILQSIEQSLNICIQQQGNNRETKSYNLLKLLDYICVKKEIVQNYNEIIEEKFVNMYTLMSKVQYTDDFMNYLVSIYSQNIQTEFKFHQFQTVILQDMKQKCDSFSFHFDDHAFVFMNRTLYYNQELFDQVNFNNFFDITMHCISMCIIDKSFDAQLSIILLNAFIVEKGDMLSQQQIQEIYAMYQKLIQDQELVIENEELIYLIILSLFITQKQIIVQTMKDDINNFTKTLLKSSIFFSTLFDIKIFQLGIQEIFTYLYQQNDEDDLLFEVFQLIILHLKFYQNLKLIEIYFAVRKEEKLTDEEQIYVDNQKRYLQLLEYPFENGQWYISNYPKNQKQIITKDFLQEDSDADSSFEYIISNQKDTSNHQTRKQNKTQRVFTHILYQDQYQKLNEIVTQLRNEQKFIQLVQKLSPEIYNLTNDVFFDTRQFIFEDQEQKQLNIRKVVKIDYSVFNNQL